MRALITGANRGIGAEMLGQLRARGDTAVGTSRSGADDLLPLDVTKPDQMSALASTLAGQPIDLLICNSGVYLDKGKAFEDLTDPQLWTDTFAVNVTGVYLTVASLLPNLLLSQSPKIAIVSSQMGSSTRANGNGMIYRASKSAALNLGRNMAVELESQGIPVGIYHPGWVRTDMGGGNADISVSKGMR